MLPKAHIILGAIFSLIAFYFFHLTIIEAGLIFLSSVLIDFDHYMFGAVRNKTLNLKKLYFWHKNLGSSHKPMFHIFHSLEFLLLILILSFYYHFFLFILIGMVFHSILDLIDLIKRKAINCREFSLIRFLILRKKYPKKYF
ncbi:MAG: hypothetical protein WCX73_02615 [Candidatus Pacearchaeota archaeon]|jgi:hypothetical protein